MKKIFAFAAAAVTALSVSAEVINFNTAKDWAKNRRLKFIDGGIMEFTGGRMDLASKKFPIDPAKKYVFSAEVRTKPGTPAGSCYVGNWSIMEGNRRMVPSFVLTIPRSDSKLLEDAASGSNRVVISRPACCKKDKLPRGWMLAFDTKPDFSDLPNTSIIVIDKAEFEGGKVILTLKKKLPRSYKANTPVRFQRSRGGMYGGMSGKLPGEEWQKLTWTVSGRAVNGNPANKWWAGATHGAVRIIANYRKTKDAVFQVRNVKMTVTE